MHRRGHLGAALFVYTPLGVVGGLLGGIQVAIVGAAVALTLATVPDFDMKIPFVEHRGLIHTVWFAAVVGLPLAGLGAILGLRSGPLVAVGLALFMFLAGVTAIASHILADALTPMGVQPFGRSRRRTYSAGLTKASSPVANNLLLAIGGVAAGCGLLLVLGV